MKNLFSSFLLSLCFFIFITASSCTTAPEVNTKTTGSNNNEAKPPTTSSKTSDKKSKKTEEEVKSQPNRLLSVCTDKENKDTRTMEVKKTNLGGCELFYTKFGNSQSVATANIGTQYCEEVKERIKSNLEKAGYTCR